MPQRFVATSLLLGLLLGQSAAKDKPSKYETTVAADKNGTVVDSQYVTNGDSHVRRLFTNYISYKFKGEGETIHLTVTCEEDWKWNRCFALSAGESYHALFEFHNGHGDDFVQLTGQPGGNLTKPVTTKNRIVNFATN
jgi:hypothetical protein